MNLLFDSSPPVTSQTARAAAEELESVRHGRQFLVAAVAFLVLASLVTIVAYVARIGTDRLSSTLPLLVLYLGYAIIARGLLYSESVRAFFRAHRDPTPRR